MEAEPQRSGRAAGTLLLRLAARAKGPLTGRSLPWLAALLAIAFTLPALGAGWILDDHYHRTVLKGTSRFRDLLGPPWEMFRFFRGDPLRTRRVMDIGLFPWWTYPGLKAEFLQTVTVLTHRLDYQLWPDSPVLMHAHSLIWYGVLVAVVAVLYRRMFGRTWQAGLAAVLFALDDAHGTPAGWLANRNALVTATFGVAAIIFHDRSRRGGRPKEMVLALLFLAASLWSKEEGISTCAYLLAYALFLDPAGFRKGGLALTPYAIVVLLWRTIRAYQGYGVEDMGLYVDPITDPGPFWQAVLARAPILLLGQWGLPPSDIHVLLREAGRRILWCVAVVFLAWLAFAMAPVLRRDRLARFWAAGMLLSVIPVCATFSMDRLLTFAGIGAFGLLVQFWASVFGDPDMRPTARSRRIAAVALGWVLVGVHLILGPLALPLRAGFPTGPKAWEDGFYVNTPLDAAVAEQTVVIVNAPSPLHAGYLPIRRELNGLPLPRFTRVLARGLPSVEVRRQDDWTLVIRPERGYLDWVADKLFHGERQPMARGQKVELTGMTVEVTEMTNDGRPAEAAFRFAVALEDSSLRWLCYRGGAFVPWTPPAVGASVVLKTRRLPR
jgi:hypothetical protein